MLTYNNDIGECLADHGLDCEAVNSILSLAAIIPLSFAKKLIAAAALTEICGITSSSVDDPILDTGDDPILDTGDDPI